MQKIHALLIALAVGFAVVAGAFAAFRTTQLGPSSSQQISPALLAAQNRALDRTEAALRRSARTRPPKLPKVPTTTVTTTRPAARPAVVTTTAHTRTSSSPTTHSDDGEHSDDHGAHTRTTDD